MRALPPLETTGSLLSYVVSDETRHTIGNRLPADDRTLHAPTRVLAIARCAPVTSARLTWQWAMLAVPTLLMLSAMLYFFVLIFGM
jgi:hypothetical protein